MSYSDSRTWLFGDGTLNTILAVRMLPTDVERAWPRDGPLGRAAEEAAGTIHSDLQKGFIRAEVVSYEDIVHLHSMANARSQGRLRLEGRTYPVQDGEIVHVRFNL